MTPSSHVHKRLILLAIVNASVVLAIRFIYQPIWGERFINPEVLAYPFFIVGFFSTMIFSLSVVTRWMLSFLPASSSEHQKIPVNQKWLWVVLGGIFLINSWPAVRSIASYLGSLKPSPIDLQIIQHPTVLPTKTIEAKERPPTMLIFQKSGKLTAFDFDISRHIDLGLIGITRYLWSNDGKLAVLVQGEYGGRYEGQSPFIPNAFATTAGFNYLLYLVDLAGGSPKLLLSEVFGEVFWKTDSSGLYVSERYFEGEKFLLDNQSSFQPDTERFFFVSLEGEKSAVSAEEFQRASLTAPRTPLQTRLSSVVLDTPDGQRFTATVTGEIGYELISVTDHQGREIVTLPGRDPTWEPISSASISKEDAARIISELPEVKDFLQRVPNGKVVFDHENPVLDALGIPRPSGSAPTQLQSTQNLFDELVYIISGPTAELLVQDSSGRQIGYQADGSFVSTIPGATYTRITDEAKLVIVPNPLTGHYKVQVIALGTTSTYGGAAYSFVSGETKTDFTGTVTVGNPQEYGHEYQQPVLPNTK